MKKRSLSLVCGVLIAIVLFASGAIAGEKESSESTKQFFDGQKTKIETLTDNSAAMKDYVSSIKDVNVRYKDGNTLLHYAANRGYLDVVALLLKRGADINARDKDGRTPLHEAMAYRRYDVARFLIENGADMSLTNKYGETPLISIVYMDNKKMAVDLVNFFMAKGFNISRSADAKLLNESILRGHHDVAVILLEKGVAFNDSSLRDAASKGYEDIFATLLARGADPQQKDILRAAAASGSVGILKTLLEKGQNPTAEDVDLALYKGKRDAAVLLNTALVRSGGQEVDLTARCRMKPDPGPCMAIFHAGYYEELTKTCMPFTYGGCGGTVPFETQDACKSVCEGAR
jgi:ankyrin repeat protein